MSMFATRVAPRASSALLVTVLGTMLGASLAACSSSSTPPVTGAGATTTAQPATTTIPVATAAQAYTEPGPHPVGVTTLTLPKGNKVEVWYPAVAGSTGTDTYDVRDFVPPSIKALLKGDARATFTTNADRDAAVAAGAFPVVLFSHGFSGMRLQSSFLTSHLASWGMIVASPDHPSRDLFHALQFQFGNAADSVADLEATLALLETQNAKTGSLLAHHVDVGHVAAVGHSAGGATVVGAARDSSAIDGYVSLASGIFVGTGGTATTVAGATTTSSPPLPAKPSLFVAGANDHVAVFTRVTEPAFRAAPAPTRLWVIAKAGHNAFDDFCTFGNGKGIIGVAEASGLGPILATPSFASFKTLGEDGCKAPDVKVQTTWPIIRHVVTAWLRSLFGIDANPVGLDNSVADQYAVSVRIEARPG